MIHVSLISAGNSDRFVGTDIGLLNSEVAEIENFRFMANRIGFGGLHWNSVLVEMLL